MLRQSFILFCTLSVWNTLVLVNKAKSYNHKKVNHHKILLSFDLLVSQQKPKNKFLLFSFLLNAQ